MHPDASLFIDQEGRTIGGRLVELAGVIPKIGDRFLLSGLELEVLRTSPTRIERLVIRRGAPAPTALDRAGPGSAGGGGGGGDRGSGAGARA